VLENAVWGIDFVFAKYAKATPAILVDKGGSEHIGTGSIVRFGSPTNHKFFLLTSRHVVDKTSGIIVRRIEIHNEVLTDFVGDWHLGSSDDLAAIEVAWMSDAPYFCIDYEVHPLERVTSLGYPKIPFADDAYLAFHSGEVNTAFRTTSREETFLISNQVGPGSSGGPVMDSKGYLVGVAAKAFQGKMEPDAEYLINWNAAITFKRVRDFLESVSGLKDWTESVKDWIDK
jgi:S1-C subfamily serine protease